MNLPPELVHGILREAWATVESKQEWGTRWDFFRDVSLVSKAWRSIMTEVALRRVVVETCRDFESYKRIITKEFKLGVDPDRKHFQRVHPSAHEYFECSDLYITLTDMIPDSIYARIPIYIPRARYIEVIITNLRGNVPFLRMFNCLTQYTAVPHITLRFTSQARIPTYVLVLPQNSGEVRGVTYLRLANYPRCDCCNSELYVKAPGPHALHNRTRRVYLPAGSHRPHCFSHRLPTHFPDLNHLHFETPFFLKLLKLPPSVVQLTLEAPPVHYLPGLGYYSVLLEWNIVSAISAGLLRRADEAAPRKRIVVNCGPSKPLNCEEVVSACEAGEVDLEFHHVYEVPSSAPASRALKVEE